MKFARLLTFSLLMLLALWIPKSVAIWAHYHDLYIDTASAWVYDAEMPHFWCTWLASLVLMALAHGGFLWSKEKYLTLWMASLVVIAMALQMGLVLWLKVWDGEALAFNTITMLIAGIATEFAILFVRSRPEDGMFFVSSGIHRGVVSKHNHSSQKMLMSRLERWTKFIGGIVVVATFLLAVITYWSESGVRSFTQKQQAWSIINEHALDYPCNWDRDKDQSATKSQVYHKNSGQIEAMQFLIAQKTGLTGIGLPCSEFGNLRAKGAHLNKAGFWLSNFTDADFRYADLSGAVLNRSTLNGADFGHARLKQGEMHGVSAVGANFSSANLSLARMPGSDLTRSNFSHADLRGADLDDSQVTDADFTAVITDCRTSYIDACYVKHKPDKHGRTGEPINWPASFLKECAPNWSKHKDDSDLPDRKKDNCDFSKGEIDG